MEPSRDHPTPYPGKIKQRKSIRQSIKEQENKTLTEINDLMTTTTKRQKHILSISKSVNNLDLSAKDKPTKSIRRLSVSSKNAVPVSKTESKDIRFAVLENKSTASKSSPLNGAALPKPGRTLEVESKVKPSTKALSVSFQGPLPKSQAKATASSKDVLLTTPGLNKSSISTTPLEDSNHGQRRRFNTLMASTYWLSQIKLSESAGKHAISLGFFRLALESNAEPFQRLCDELKVYAKKHHVLEYGEVAKDVLLSYGILEEIMSADIDEHLVEIEATGEGSFSECKGLLTPSNEKCSIIVDSSFEESEVYDSKIDEDVIEGGDNIQEAVQNELNASLLVATGSKLEVLSNKACSAERKGNSNDACDANIQPSILSQKICTEKGNFIEVDAVVCVASPNNTESNSAKKNATRKRTTLIPVPGIKSQTSVRKSFNTDSAQKIGSTNKLHCTPRRSQTVIVTTLNESHSRKSSRQGAKKGAATSDFLHSDQPSSSDNAKEEDKDKRGSQNRQQLSKCKDSKDLPREFVENLETSPSHATLPLSDFDIQNMSVDTLMEEVVSCIVSSMDDRTDSPDQGSVKSSDYQNIDASCVGESSAEVLHSSDISTTSKSFGDAHVNTTGFSIAQNIDMAARNSDNLDDSPNPKDGYAEETDETVSFLKEKGEKEDNSTTDTAQQDKTRHDILEDNQSRVVKGKPELDITNCGSHGSIAITGKGSPKKDLPHEILAILKKENTLNESCEVPLTEGESRDTLVKEVMWRKDKSNEGSKSHSHNTSATPGTVRRSSRLRDRKNT